MQAPRLTLVFSNGSDTLKRKTPRSRKSSTTLLRRPCVPLKTAAMADKVAWLQAHRPHVAAFVESLIDSSLERARAAKAKEG